MTSPLHDPDEDFEEPPHLRRLRLLVTVLTTVLIVGMLTMIALFVIRLGLFPDRQTDDQIAAETVILPQKAEITAIGRGKSTILITTTSENGEILHVFDQITGDLISETAIERK
ncbi:MAG: DUF6476 family protein [Pseudomonadota bacterium]